MEDRDLYLNPFPMGAFSAAASPINVSKFSDPKTSPGEISMAMLIYISQ